jgi:hypothetical protein
MDCSSAAYEREADVLEGQSSGAGGELDTSMNAGDDGCDTKQNNAPTPRERVIVHVYTVAPACTGRTAHLLLHAEGLGH